MSIIFLNPIMKLRKIIESGCAYLLVCHKYLIHSGFSSPFYPPNPNLRGLPNTWNFKFLLSLSSVAWLIWDTGFYSFSPRRGHLLSQFVLQWQSIPLSSKSWIHKNGENVTDSKIFQAKISQQGIAK